MQSTKKLSRVLHELVGLLEDEAGRNAAFAERLEAITNALPTVAKKEGARKSRSLPNINLPDVLTALEERGEDEFRFWLRTLDIPTLKAVIKVNGFDPAKVSTRWTDQDKFVGLVAEQAVARLKRGSAFLPPRAGTEGTQ